MNTPVNRRAGGLFAAKIGAAALVLSLASPSSVSAVTATTTKPLTNAQGQGIDPTKVPADRAGKGARAKVLKERIKAGASS